jgi:hypothetical protein
MTRETELDPALRKRLEDDRKTRTRRQSTPEVLEIAAEEVTRLIPEGAALVLAASRDTSLLDQVVAAVRSRDKTRIDAAAERLGRALKRFEPVVKNNSEALDRLLTFPVHGELSYGDKPLLGTVAVAEGGDISGVYLPYTGGKLAPEKFRLLEFVRKGASDSLRVVIILRPPRLTPVEISAIKAVGPERTEALIGTSALGYATVVYLVVVAFVVLTAMGEVCGTEVVGGLSEAERASLGPSPSVDDLLAARRRMLSRR